MSLLDAVKLTRPTSTDTPTQSTGGSSLLNAVRITRNEQPISQPISQPIQVSQTQPIITQKAKTGIGKAITSIKGYTLNLVQPKEQPLISPIPKAQVLKPERVAEQKPTITKQPTISPQKIVDYFKIWSPKISIDFISGFFGEREAGRKRLGEQNIPAQPEAKYTPKNYSQTLGSLGWKLVMFNYEIKFAGLEAPLAGGTEAISGIYKMSPIALKVGSMRTYLGSLASKKVAKVVNFFEKSPLTFQDAIDVTANRATPVKVAQYMKAKETGLLNEIVSAHKASGKSSKMKMGDFLKKSIEQIKKNLKSTLTKEEQKLLTAKIKPDLEQIIPAGEYAPQDVINKVIGSELEKVAEGKTLLKMALQAKQTGQNIALSKTAPKLVGISEKQLTAPAKLLVSHEGAPDIKQVQAYKTLIQEGGEIEPVKVIREGEKYGIEDGKHRFEAYKELGYKDIPIEIVKAPKPIIQPQKLGGVKVKPVEPKPEAKAPSKIAKSIEAKAIEQKLTKGFEGIAGYDKITIKEQARLASETMKDLENARAIIRGEKPLPQGLRGTSLITAMEEYIKETGDVKLAYELANSPLISETSTAAQELRLAAEREPDSLTLRLRELKDLREQALERRTGKSPSKAVKDEVGKIKEQIRTPSKYDWGEFLKLIQC